jgi:hypothetical protein
MKKLYQHGKEIDKGKLLKPVKELKYTGNEQTQKLQQSVREFQNSKMQQPVAEFEQLKERMELLQKELRETKRLMKLNK